MKTDALILARSGSKGLYKKCTILIGDKPLIEYTIEAACGSPSVRNVYLSTDDAELLKKYKGHRGMILIRRPKPLAGDGAPIKDAVKNALSHMGRPGPDMVAVLSPTAPFRTAKHVEDAIKFARSLKGFDSVAGVTRLRTHPFGGLSLDGSKRARPLVKGAFKYTNRQDQPPLYRLNRAIWLIRPKQIDGLNGLLMSGKSYGFEMDEVSGVDIETQYDVAMAEAALSFKNKRVSWNERGRFNVQRFYVHDDPQMGILRNAFDSAAYERHFGRYRFFLKHVKPRDSVLDIACGSGYGSELLASKALAVRGVDGDRKTIEYARRNHGRPNIRFDASPVESFDPKELYSKIISVETIEHLAEPEKFLVRAKSWLKPGGEVWLTCPVSEDITGQTENPFHISNLTYNSLSAMMKRHFDNVDLFGLSGKESFRTDTLNNKTAYIIARGAMKK
ncbi:MAG: methyltransferase domain-containing protein [Candidatus Omnitrophica bacterium]|nr:methyltransferase domain-containing protein [Candidatus Omnitrophota bacterium]